MGSGLTGFRKLVVGRKTWRIVYRVTPDKSIEICEIWAIGARADAAVYREATARLRSLNAQTPDLVDFVETVERLGRLAGDVVEQQTRSEPVPDWLAERLVHTVGMSRARVAALSLEAAVDAWTRYVAGASAQAGSAGRPD